LLWSWNVTGKILMPCLLTGQQHSMTQAPRSPQKIAPVTAALKMQDLRAEFSFFFYVTPTEIVIMTVDEAVVKRQELCRLIDEGRALLYGIR
jgi:hypothetical protein